MHTLSKISIAGFALFALAACNSSSQTVPGGSVCPAGYNPTPMDLSNNPALKKVTVDPKANQSASPDSQMPPGIYVYSLADLTYNQKGPAASKPIQIQVHDLAAAGVSQKQSVICLANAKMNMQLPDTPLDAVTDVVVCPDFHQVVKTRHYRFNITNGSINFTSPCLKDQCLASAAAVTKDDQEFIRDDAFNYQWRMSHEDDVSKWIMSVRMVFVNFGPNNPVPPECNACVQPAPSAVTAEGTLCPAPTAPATPAAKPSP